MRGYLRLALCVALPSLALLLSGCPLDERTLNEETLRHLGGSGNAAPTDAGAPGTSGAGGEGGSEPSGAGAAGETQAGGASTGGSFSGGSAGMPPSLGGSGMDVPSPCPDLDGNAIGDCTETLVQNASFDGDATGWLVEDSIQSEWNHADASGQDSGSLAVRSNTTGSGPSVTMSGVRQCLSVVGGSKYDVGTRLFTASGQSSGTSGLTLWFFDGIDCSGSQLDSFISPQSGQTDQWGSVVGTATAPAAAVSMLVRLVVVKPIEQAPLQVLFDNVLVKKH